MLRLPSVLVSGYVFLLLFGNGINAAGEAPGIYTGNLGEKPLAYVEGRILVKFTPQIGEGPARGLARATGARLERQSYGKAFYIASVAPGREQSVAAVLARNPHVVYAHVDWLAYASFVPDDPLYQPFQWHLDNPEYGGVEMEEAWDLGGGGLSSVIVAVLDTGIAYENYGPYQQAPDLSGTSFTSGYDFINNDTHANDDASHGTHVAGTIAQTTNNLTGVAGIAYATTLMPVKVLGADGSGSISAIAEGIIWATDNGAHIINMSLGSSANPRFLGALEEAVAYAQDNNVLLVAAAGNSGRTRVDYPAGFAEVVAVAATRYDETLASYSNSGSGIELSAPGGDTGDLNGDGFDDMVLQQTFNPNTNDVTDFGYWFFSGTSMATPHVAGAAALLFASGVEDAATVRQILRDSADDIGASGYDTTYGYGLLNVGRALQMVSGPVDLPPSVTIIEPSEGAVVSSEVLITVAATDDNGVNQVEFYIDGVARATDTDPINGWTYHWDTTSENDGAHEIVSRATDTIGQTAADLISVTVSNNTGSGLHVEDIDGAAIKSGRDWLAQVTVTVHDATHQPVAGAVVLGLWDGSSLPFVTTTNASGEAVFLSSSLDKKTTPSITFRVQDVQFEDVPYDPGQNHDPDGDSDGTQITLSR